MLWFARHSAAALLSALIILGSATTARAQAVTTRQAAISGVVLDSATGRGARRSRICALIPLDAYGSMARCANVDTTGAYRIDSLPRRSLRVGVDCETMHRFAAKSLAEGNVILDSDTVRRDWLVSTVGCDPRPVRRVTGVFHGHYTSGFENTSFVPCAADVWLIPGDSLGNYSFDARPAWVTWPASFVMKWPDAPHDRDGTVRYYVRWRGTVAGPGHYGQLGGAAFLFIVDSIIEMRASARSDCR